MASRMTGHEVTRPQGFRLYVKLTEMVGKACLPGEGKLVAGLQNRPVPPRAATTDETEVAAMIQRHGLQNDIVFAVFAGGQHHAASAPFQGPFPVSCQAGSLADSAIRANYFGNSSPISR